MHDIEFLKIHFTCSREIMTLVATCNLHGITKVLRIWRQNFQYVKGSSSPNFLFAQVLLLQLASFTGARWKKCQKRFPIDLLASLIRKLSRTGYTNIILCSSIYNIGKICQDRNYFSLTWIFFMHTLIIS